MPETSIGTTANAGLKRWRLGQQLLPLSRDFPAASTKLLRRRRVRDRAKGDRRSEYVKENAHVARRQHCIRTGALVLVENLPEETARRIRD